MAVVAPGTMMRGAVTPQRGCEGRAAGGVHAIEALRDRLRRDRTQPPAAAAGRRRSLDRLRLPGLSDRSSSLVCWTGFPVPRIDRRCFLFAGQASRSLGSIAGAAGDRSPVPVSCLLDRLPGPSDRSPGQDADRSPVLQGIDRRCRSLVCWTDFPVPRIDRRVDRSPVLQGIDRRCRSLVCWTDFPVPRIDRRVDRSPGRSPGRSIDRRVPHAIGQECM